MHFMILSPTNVKPNGRPAVPTPKDYYCVPLEVDKKRRFAIAMGNNAAFICPICGGVMLVHLNSNPKSHPSENQYCCEVKYKVFPANNNKIEKIKGNT